MFSSVSVCHPGETYYECEPCKALRCGDPQPFVCWSTFGSCSKPGCYCIKPFVWNSDGICVEPVDCGREKSEEQVTITPTDDDYKEEYSISDEDYDLENQTAAV